MNLAWSNRATTDRLAIFIWIAEDNPQAAADVDDRIEAAAQRLKDFPNSGRPGRIEGTRELVIAHTPYIALYQIIGDTVRILRVIHGARMWPHDIPPQFAPE